MKEVWEKVNKFLRALRDFHLERSERLMEMAINEALIHYIEGVLVPPLLLCKCI